METTLSNFALDLYLAGRYGKLKKEGTLGIIREMVSKVLFSKFWANKKTWKIAIDPQTDIASLPFLSDPEKVKLCHMVAQQTFYPRKHHGKVFAYRGHVYVKDDYDYFPTGSDSKEKTEGLHKLRVPVELLHDMGVFRPFNTYSSAVPTLANKVRLYTLMYRDKDDFTKDELALLNDDLNVPKTGVVYTPNITKAPVLSLV